MIRSLARSFFFPHLLFRAEAVYLQVGSWYGRACMRGPNTSPALMLWYPRSPSFAWRRFIVVLVRSRDRRADLFTPNPVAAVTSRLALLSQFMERIFRGADHDFPLRPMRGSDCSGEFCFRTVCQLLLPSLWLLPSAFFLAHKFFF